MKSIVDAVANVHALDRNTLMQYISECDRTVERNIAKMKNKSAVEKIELANKNDEINRYRTILVRSFNGKRR